MNKILDEYNLWNKKLDFGVDRLFAYPKIVELLSRKEIQVITGIRRCGKTTLMRQCMRHLVDTGVNRENILFIPCDNPLLEIKTFKELDDIIQEFKKDKKGTAYLFLDEIQTLKNFEKYLKASYDSNTNTKFVISGSTSTFFASGVASLLTGRHFYHKIDTMLFKEFQRLSPNKTLREYIEWGGFPEVVKAKTITEKEELLDSYLNTIIERDIIERFGIRNKKKTIALLHGIILTNGGKINLAKLASQFALNVRSIERYISIAEDAFLFQEVPFFSYSKRKNRHMQPKLYPADIGFTRLLSRRFEDGRSLEWAVAHFLKKVSYWSDSEHEVDFVNDEYAIQVTSARDVPAREAAALHKFNKKFLKKSLVLGPQTTDSTTSVEIFLSQ